MRKLQLKQLISSSFSVHVDNAERYHLGQEMPRGLEEQKCQKQSFFPSLLNVEFSWHII